ncbi:diguanylate cyclase [Microbacterium sp. NPDC057407]|uniref:sensor domain-containing diguanylate cyclase n=1 Tax=Microbacterium sp. NPDC057407 TaxID=3346120 RepID=UPI00366DFDF6
MMAVVDEWFDGAPCGLLATDVDGVVVRVNDTLAAWTGHSRLQLEQTRVADLLTPDSRAVFETLLAQVLTASGVVEEVALTLRTASGTALPALVNARRDDGGHVVRFAFFNATERVRYEEALLAARHAAELSERRVRILQDVSTAFDVSATDSDVARSFASVAREAFQAQDTAVFLTQDDGDLLLAGGTNPLEGRVAPVPQLRQTTAVTVVHDDNEDYAELAAAMRGIGLASLSVMPLLADGQRLGVLVCFYRGRTDFDTHFYDLQQAIGRQASQTLLRVRLQRRLAQLALHDQLTGVANRPLLQVTLDSAITSAAAASQPLSVVFLDVDEFKSINDAYGHAAGDMVLVELATRLRGAVRTGDIVGRIGGDEFVALCPGADEAAAEAIAERILAVCRLPIDVAGGFVTASVSVGVSLYRPGVDPAVTAQHLLGRADAAMYDSKRAGKNRVTVDAL